MQPSLNQEPPFEKRPALSAFFLTCGLYFLVYRLVYRGIWAIFGLVSLLRTYSLSALSELLPEEVADRFSACADAASVSVDFCGVALALVVLFCFRQFVHEKRFLALPEKRPDCRLLFAACGYLLLGIVEILIFSDFTVPAAQSVAASFRAGFLEETVFRVVPLTFVLRRAKREQSMLPPVLVTSVCFALSHAVNLLSGANLLLTVVQILCAFAVGLFLSVLFLETESFLLPTAFHVLVDLVATLDAATESNLVLSGAFGPATIVDFVLAVALGALGWIFLLKKYHETTPKQV